jgi:Xaa-Pro aminopeptidase
MVTGSCEEIGPDVFEQRRQTLLDSLGSGVALLYSDGEYTETGYRADALFWYLTGIDDPGAVLMLAPDFDYEQTLFLRSRDPEAEQWTGLRASLTDSLRQFLKVDKLYRVGRIDRMVLSAVKKSPNLHLVSRLRKVSDDVPPDLKYYEKLSERVPGLKIHNSSRFLEQMRMIKSPPEIEAIARAIEITYQGITDVLAALKPGLTEYQLDAVLESSFKRQGAQHQAFSPIIASGPGSIILHYEKRNRVVAEGQLLLMDVGAEWDHYCADISRTVPVDGQFTARQAEVYDLVLEAQDSAIAQVRPGALVQDVHLAVERVLRRAGYIDFYVHGTSHHLGLSVHDQADGNLPLQAGMVITIEPGIYIQDEDLGIRIEDDVLVTAEGSRLLSAAIPRTRYDIEQWMASAGSEAR